MKQGVKREFSLLRKDSESIGSLCTLSTIRTFFNLSSKIYQKQENAKEITIWKSVQDSASAE